MKRSTFVKGDDPYQARKRKQRVVRLFDDFAQVARFAKMGEYETWIVKLHLAFLDFCWDIEDYLGPQEYGTLSEGPFKDLADRAQEQYPPDPELKGVVSRRTGLPVSMKPDGTPNVEAIRPLRQKYPRVWWLWDHAERTGHVQMIPRPDLWERGGAEIPAETKMAILVFPDTTKEDLERTWQSVKRLKDKVYHDAYPRSRIHVPLEKWPDIVRACVEFHERGKYPTVGKKFGIKRDTVRTLYEKAHRFVFCGRSEKAPDDAKWGTGTPDDLLRDDVRIKRDEETTIRYKPRQMSYVRMTPEQRALERQAAAISKQASK